MTLEQKLQRAWDLARFAREDRIKLEAVLARQREIENEAVDEALALAREFEQEMRYGVAAC